MSRRTETRLAAIKTLYAQEVDTTSGKSVSEFMLDTMTYYDANEEELVDGEIERAFLKELIEGVFTHLETIDTSIRGRLSDTWPYERLSPIIRATLRLAVFELALVDSTPHNVIIDEYTTLTGHYFDEQDIAFVNSILDKIANHLRHQAS